MLKVADGHIAVGESNSAEGILSHLFLHDIIKNARLCSLIERYFLGGLVGLSILIGCIVIHEVTLAVVDDNLGSTFNVNANSIFEFGMLDGDDRSLER